VLEQAAEGEPAVKTQLEAENIVLNMWATGTPVEEIVRVLRDRRLETSGHGAKHPYCDPDVRNLVARARRRGDVRAVRREKYATRVSCS
jgi:hypothetical protein